MEKEQKATCPKCKRDFSWVNTGDVWSGGKDKESIDCPYCGKTFGTVMTSGYISTKKQEGE